jgi:hypothetical protein
MEFLRDRRLEPDEAALLDPRPDTPEHEGPIFACAFCLRPVTSAGARIEVGGSHSHSFVNPHGFRFRIGCFARVVGCRLVGEPSGEWSWFPPCRWQIELCGACREQLGWFFSSRDERFHGLVLDRLVEREGGPA